MTDNQFYFSVALFALAVTTISILLSVIFLQNRKIQKLNTPKYGFLGKPLLWMAVSVAIVGGASGLYFSAGIEREPDSISVTDLTELRVNIASTQINADQKLYRFNAIPILGGVAWGEDVDSTFKVTWNIINSSVDTKVETNLSKSFYGGVVSTLEVGENKIVAEIEYYNSTTLELVTARDEVIITIN